jgi:hypothetical protein
MSREAAEQLRLQKEDTDRQLREEQQENARQRCEREKEMTALAVATEKAEREAAARQAADEKRQDDIRKLKMEMVARGREFDERCAKDLADQQARYDERQRECLGLLVQLAQRPPVVIHPPPRQDFLTPVIGALAQLKGLFSGRQLT